MEEQDKPFGKYLEELMMKRGKAFELFVKHLLLKVGFLEVNSDGLYIFDGSAGQMI